MLRWHNPALPPPRVCMERGGLDLDRRHCVQAMCETLDSETTIGRNHLRKSHYSEEQIIGALRLAEAGQQRRGVCRQLIADEWFTHASSLTPVLLDVLNHEKRELAPRWEKVDLGQLSSNPKRRTLDPEKFRIERVEMGESRTPRPNRRLKRYATGIVGGLITRPGPPTDRVPVRLPAGS